MDDTEFSVNERFGEAYMTFSKNQLTELLLNQVTAPIPPLHEVVPDVAVPGELQDFLDRALEKDREQRFQSAGEMLDALDAVDTASVGGKRAKPRRNPGSSASLRRPPPTFMNARRRGFSICWCWARFQPPARL